MKVVTPKGREIYIERLDKDYIFVTTEPPLPRASTWWGKRQTYLGLNLHKVVTRSREEALRILDTRIDRSLAKKALKTLPPDYANQFQHEIDRLLDLAERTWGVRPKVEVNLLPAIMIRADFNIKGFAHEGRNIIVHPGNATSSRSPVWSARRVFSELVDHRNQCGDCGEGIAPLYYRVRNKHWSGLKLKLDVPADALERELQPGRARQLDQRLAKRREKTLAIIATAFPCLRRGNEQDRISNAVNAEIL